MEKFCLHPLTAPLRHPVQKYFFVFCFNQKNLLQNLVEIILRYHKSIFRFLGPLGPPYNQKEEK